MRPGVLLCYPARSIWAMPAPDSTAWMPCRGQYDADEAQRLAILKFAAILGADFVDVELKAAPFFFAGERAASL